MIIQLDFFFFSKESVYLKTQKVMLHYILIFENSGDGHFLDIVEERSSY